MMGLQRGRLGEMIWEDAIIEARESLGYSPCGYIQDDEEVADLARELMSGEASKIARENHKEYLESQEWKDLRAEILKRDKGYCQDCLKIIPEIIILFKKIPHTSKSFNVLASEVHHMDYSFLHTDEEADYCISLCGLCHKIRHSQTQSGVNFFATKRYNHIIKKINNTILKEPRHIQEAKEQHESFLKSITVKPKLKGVDNGEIRS